MVHETQSPGARIRSFRKERKMTLETLAERIEQEGIKRPSAAKLSRIETGQPIPTEMLETLSRITSIPAAELRPDLAAIIEGGR